MDDVIYEESNGTGNLKVHIYSRMAEKRVYPAIKIGRLGTRLEAVFLEPNVLQKTWGPRKLFSEMDEIEAMEKLQKHMRETKNNKEFFDAMTRAR
jgi:transcription termination factor Rho